MSRCNARILNKELFHIQCSKKKLDNMDFCGIHSKVVNKKCSKCNTIHHYQWEICGRIDNPNINKCYGPITKGPITKGPITKGPITKKRKKKLVYKSNNNNLVLLNTHNLIDNTPFPIDNTPDLIENILELVDNIPEPIDNTLEPIENPLELVDDIPEVIEEPPIIIENTLELVGDTPEPIDDTPEVIENILELVEKPNHNPIQAVIPNIIPNILEHINDDAKVNIEQPDVVDNDKTDIIVEKKKKKIKKYILELIPFEIDDVVYLLDLDNKRVYNVDETQYIGKLIDNEIVYRRL